MRNVRDGIRAEIAAINPFDDQERDTQQDVLAWVDSGAELCRLQKPATPPKHLISYFVVVDDDHVLLVDHINAGLWLPTGGHVDPGEHPRDTVVREMKEELGVEAEFLLPSPVLLTSTTTVGKTSGHTDVSLWYALRCSRNAHFDYDDSEFTEVRWFGENDIPFERSDPEMRRFIQKLAKIKQNQKTNGEDN